MVESIILSNSSKNIKVIMDMLTSPYVLEYVDWGTLDASHKTSKYPEQIGEKNTSTILGTRPISISGWIVGRSEQEILNYKKVLNGMINPFDVLDLEYEQYVLHFKPKNTIKYSTKESESNEVLCKFLISGICFNPLFEEKTEQYIPLAKDICKFMFPFIIPETGMVMSYKMPSTTVNILNEGTVSTGCEIIFHAKGIVLNPTIVNVNTQERITIKKELDVNEEVHVITTDGEEEIYGIVDGEKYNYYYYLDLDSSWLQLGTGDNLLMYDAEENPSLLDITIVYNNKYLEVQ